MFTATGEELRLARNGYVFQNKSIWIEENNTEKKTSSTHAQSWSTQWLQSQIMTQSYS